MRIALLMVLSTPLCFGGITLKLRGGMGYIFGGDWNKGMDGWNKYVAGVSNTCTGSFEKLDFGMDFDGEIIFNFNRYFGVGVGAGYFRMGKENRVTWESGSGILTSKTDSTWTHEISVIPIVLNLHYRLPLGKSADFGFSLGGGYYLGTFNFKNVYDNSFFIFFSKGTETFKASKGAIGFQGSLGVDIKLGGKVYLCIDLFGRYSKLTQLSGTRTNKGNNIFGPYDNTEDGFGLWLEDYTEGGTAYAIVVLSKGAPSGANISNPRQLEFDLSGAAARIGIRIDF